MPKSVDFAPACLLAAGILAGPAHAYLGALDPGFGNAGQSFVNFAASEYPDVAHAVAIQADGKIVSAGETYPGYPQAPLAIARHLPSGTLDESFASGGKLTDAIASGFLGGTTAKAFGVAIQPDGRIVVAGSWYDAARGTGSAGTLSLVVARYSAAGVADGKVMTSYLDGHSEARTVRLQPDGKIVVCGHNHVPYTLYTSAGPRRFTLARYNADLTLDTSFNFTGKVVTSVGSGDAACLAMALQADGRIVAVGYARNASQNDIALLRYSAAGVLESAVLTDVGRSEEAASAVVIQDDGRIVVGGYSDGNSALLRFTDPGVLDASFAAGGKFVFAGRPIAALALQPDGKILALTQDFHVWRLTSAGAPDPTFGVGGRVVLAMSITATAEAMSLQADGRIVVTGSAMGPQGRDFVVARIDPAAPMADPTPAAGSLDFGGQSMNTTSLPLTVQITNGAAGAATVNSLTVTAGFAVASSSCGGSLPASSSCAIAVTFTPGAPGPHTGTLLVNTSSGVFAVSLAGSGERSLVTHYYRSILRRAPDAGGKAFWDGEASRVAGLGANVNEVWFAMAQQFYFSAEYAAFNRDNTEFITDLYNTFFNRSPDGGGLDYWKGQLDAGLPREVLLAQFMFSTEFRNLTQAIFGNTASRAEVGAVVDFYRGLLARTPDDDGFAFWVARFRSAQCQTAGTVMIVVEEISSAFTRSAEYAGRNRSNAQYVGDLYNAFLRRGGDLAGVQFWIGQLDTGARTREQLRVQFKNSPEFQGRVNAIIQQGCLQ